MGVQVGSDLILKMDLAALPTGSGKGVFMVTVLLICLFSALLFLEAVVCGSEEVA